ncbi:MAG: hypothetical protein LBV78_12480 [Kitasatospora sp.]|nr:hypothetical protein [Kitasatospora sp.]
MNDQQWAGAAALVLAIAVGAALCAGVIIIALDTSTDSTVLIEPISALAGAAVGAVATYLGLRGRGGGP